MLNNSHRSSGRRLSLVGAAVAVILPLTGCGDTADVAVEEPSEVNTGPSDGDWIRIDGTILSTVPDQFVLDYGAGNLTVELDDWDKAIEGITLMPGDRVSVTGRVDMNLFGARSIEASSVYVDNLNTVFFASAADEEDSMLTAVPLGITEPGVDYTGWVTGKADNGFVLGSGPMQIAVDTSALRTPLARKGVTVGDRVYVWGQMEFRDSGESKLEAEGLLRLINGEANSNGNESDRRPSPAAEGALASPETSPLSSPRENAK